METLELFEKDSKDNIEILKNEIKNQISQSLGKEKTLSKISLKNGGLIQ